MQSAIEKSDWGETTFSRSGGKPHEGAAPSLSPKGGFQLSKARKEFLPRTEDCANAQTKV